MREGGSSERVSNERKRIVRERERWVVREGVVRTGDGTERVGSESGTR